MGEVDIDSLQKSIPSGFQPATPQEGNLGDTTYLQSQIDELVFEFMVLLIRKKIELIAIF